MSIKIRKLLKRRYAISFLNFILFIALSHFTITYAASDNERAKAYREGIETAKQALQNQAMWERGEGDPKMVKAYREGKMMAQEALENQEKWKRGEGDPKMVKTYREAQQFSQEMVNKQKARIDEVRLHSNTK